MERVPFGNETRLETISLKCLGCGVERGHLHAYGCPLESCPKCGGRLLECSCMALSLPDEFRTVRAVAKTITRAQFFAMSEQSDALDRNYTEMAAYSWMCDNASPETREKLWQYVVDTLGAEQRGGMVSVSLEKTARTLGMTEEEAAPILEELEIDALYPDWDKAEGHEQ